MYWLTQSLLSSWKHFLDADDAYADAALSSFTGSSSILLSILIMTTMIGAMGLQ